MIFVAGVKLFDYQLDAVGRMRNGCILCGGVGSGKSRTALAYYYILFGGKIGTRNYVKMKDPCDLYIITTARKRDTSEWAADMIPFGLSDKSEINLYSNKVIIDSWNNIKKYVEVKDAFFIFDEQRVVGSGVWVKSFLKIVKNNQWILLSATPGDKWEDYIPVFVANGFYKNKSEFIRKHIVYTYYGSYPKVDRYFNTGRLLRLRERILVDMDFKRETVSHHEFIFVGYDVWKYKAVVRNRWDPWKDEPIQNATEFCYCLRKIVNTDESRITKVLEIFESHPKLIIFYNFDYELELLKGADFGDDCSIAEWNGHKHQPIPDSKSWIYLVQYNAGAEGWNCISTDTIIFFSQNYSYKTVVQASGRIDRLNTPYTDLYYFHLRSKSSIDIAISRALKSKKKFSERRFFEA